MAPVMMLFDENLLVQTRTTCFMMSLEKPYRILKRNRKE